jgi:hypothetical protein
VRRRLQGLAGAALLTLLPALVSAQAHNLALHRPATGSAACSPDETPAKAVNGSAGGTFDKFCSTGGPLFLQVDLGRAATLGSFVVRHAGAGGESPAFNTRNFHIQISTDGSTWTTPVSVLGNAANVTVHSIPPQSARHVRLNVSAGEQRAGHVARIYELEVYEAAGRR